jgi:hypothetical protein
MGERHRCPQIASREGEVRRTSLSKEEREAERRKAHLGVTAAAYFQDCLETEAHGNAFQRSAAVV